MTALDIIIKIIIPVLSFLFGFYQLKKRNDLHSLLKMKSWGLHQHIALLLGDIQGTRDQIIEDNRDLSLYRLGNAEGVAQTLLKESALLVCHYEKPDYNKIVEWVSVGKINEGYKPIFISFVPEETIFSKMKKELFNNY